MPTLADLRKRTTHVRPPAVPAASGEEAMVADERGRLKPAQIVEQKLRTALGRGKNSREIGLMTGSAPF
jgi:hypothetical protein